MRKFALSVAMTNRLDGISRLYLDANIIIYFIEGDLELRTAVADVLEQAGARGVSLLTSDIAIAECLHGAFKRKKRPLVELYRSFFADEGLISLAPIAAPVLELSAEIGAALALKTVDAIHVATAIAVGCDALLTNDNGLRAPEGLRIDQLAEMSGLRRM